MAGKNEEAPVVAKPIVDKSVECTEGRGKATQSEAPMKDDAIVAGDKSVEATPLKPKSSATGALHPLLERLETLRVLNEAYGWQLLAMLAFAQWMVKGFVWGLSMTSMDFLLREYAVSGPKLQVYRAVIMLPWAMKPIFGLVSDCFPIMGYRKAPYIVAASIAAVCAHATVGFMPAGSIQIRLLVGCLLVGCMQASVVDLLTEATYAERIREKPEHGPDLMTFVWAGITMGNLFATAAAGFIIEHLGAHRVNAILMVPAALVIVPTCLNWLQETKLSPAQIAAQRDFMRKQRELFILVMLTGAATVTLVLVGLLQDSVWVNLAAAVIVAVAILTAFTMLLRPEIGRMNCFFFIQTCCAVDISGATFYFYTDNASQYPQGPHFSKVFFASVLGVFVAALNLVGMWTYHKVMKHWRYHGLFIFANVILCLVNLICLLVYTRLNLVLGIPDSLFVLGTWGAWGIVHMWMWLPGVVLLSHLCPKGVEATMYALLAGCHNLGLSFASYSGACLLEVLDIRPNGSENEGAQFDNLWIAAALQALMPVATLVLLPWMIPNALQTDTLLDPSASPIANSPWSLLQKRWFGGGGEMDEESQISTVAAGAARAGAAARYGSVRC